jgi:hypothetical protein
MQRFGRAALLPFQLEEFVLDAQLASLQIGDRLLVRKRMPVLLVNGTLERGVLGPQRLDAFLRRHALFLLWVMTAGMLAPARSTRPKFAGACDENRRQKPISQGVRWRNDQQRRG